MKIRSAFFIMVIASLASRAYGQAVIVTDDNSYTTGETSAVLDVKSVTKGFLAPRMTEVQRLAITTPANSLLVYQTNGTSPGFYYYNGSTWVKIATGSGNVWSVVDTNIYYTGGRVGIGTDTPRQRLDVVGNIKFSGAIMPGGNAGTAGYVLSSSGAGAAPVWTDPASYLTSGWVYDGNTVISEKKFGTLSYYDLPIITNNVEKMRIKADGKVGIGKNPTQILDVLGNVQFSGALMPNSDAGTAEKFLMSDGPSTPPLWTGAWKHNGNNMNTPGVQSLGTTSYHALPFITDNTERMRILADGKVGIGTATPTQVLDVVGNVKFSGMLMPNNLPGNAGDYLTSAGAGAPPTWTSPTVLSWKPDGNDMNSTGMKSLGTTSYHDLPIITNNIEKVRIKADGKVGIGKDAPTEVLDVVGNVRFSGALMPNNTAGASGTFLMSAGAATPPVWGDAWKPDGNNMTAGVKSMGTTSYTDLPFITNNVEKVRIKADGKVGIGTAAPTEALEVSGNVKFSGALMPNNLPGSSGDFLTSAGAGSPPTWTSPSALAWKPGGNDMNSTGVKNLGTTSYHALPFITNNTEYMRIQPDGKVGIGKAAPSEVLDVQGNVRFSGALMPNNLAGSSGYFLMSNGTGTAPTWSDAWKPGGNDMNASGVKNIGTTTYHALPFITNNTEYMRIQPDGKVGIGKTAPSEVLDVQGNVRFSGALMPNNTAGTSGYILTSAGSGTPPVWTDPSTLGSSSGWALNGNSVTSIRTLGTTSSYDLPFITANVERMRVTTTGRLGIGTTAPSTTLHVVGTNPLTLQGVQTGATTDSLMTITAGTVRKIATNNLWTTTGNAGTNSGANFMGTTDNVSLRIRTNNTERAVIDSTGKMGIGTTTPSTALHVVGTNPLTLQGVQTGATTDSLMTITGGTVRKLGINNLWTTAGNSGTSGGLNFIGTTDNVSLRFRTNNTERMYIDSATGSLGMGISNALAGRLHIISGGTETTNNYLFDDYTSVADTAGIYLRRARGSLASPANLTSGDIIGQLRFIPRYNGALGTAGGSGIDAHYKGSGTNNFTDMRLYTTDSIRILIDSAGRVGVGTNTPTATLDVAGTVKVGTAGTVLTSVIKASVTLASAVSSITTSAPKFQNVTVTGANTNATVIVNPRFDLTTNVAIAGAYVSAANTVRIKFISTNGTGSVASGSVFDITVINSQ